WICWSEIRIGWIWSRRTSSRRWTTRRRAATSGTRCGWSGSSRCWRIARARDSHAPGAGSRRAVIAVLGQEPLLLAEGPRVRAGLLVDVVVVHGRIRAVDRRAHVAAPRVDRGIRSVRVLAAVDGISIPHDADEGVVVVRDRIRLGVVVVDAAVLRVGAA